jgi:KipI family sensor histidine kinase inhibitor
MIEIKLAAENAIIIYFGQHSSDALLDEIAFYSTLLKQELDDLIVDAVPSYTSLLLSYRLGKISHQAFSTRVEEIITNNAWIINLARTDVIDIPVLYDTEVGLDLAFCLDAKALDLNSFIQLHSQREYRVHAVGFSPVFAFLGTVDSRLMMPRLATPRVNTPAGSVGIADNQTAVYPVDSAGGWQIIGRTPLDLSLANPDNLTLFQVGDTVRFRSIQHAEYLALGGQL